jgi:transposase-like protein
MVSEMIKNARQSSSGRKFAYIATKSLLNVRRAVEEWESCGLSSPEFCRQHGLISSQLYKWRKDAKSGAIMSIKNDGQLHSKTELEVLRRENDELKKALGKATLDINNQSSF